MTNGCWETGRLEIINNNFDKEEFFKNLDILADYYVANQVQKINLSNQYLFIAKENKDSNYKFWLAARSGSTRMLFDPGENGVNFFVVSPDEKYLAITYVTSNSTFIYVISIGNQQLLYKYPCPYELGSCRYIWSPDSHFLVLNYSDINTPDSSGITSGIQILDIISGDLNVVLRENITRILAWHSYK